LARAYAQERLEAARREINRAMIDAAREREDYVARATMRLCATLGVATQAQARDAWRRWCAAAGRRPDPKVQAALDLLRAHARTPNAERRTPSKEVPYAG
jgi:hypothetical protein